MMDGLPKETQFLMSHGKNTTDRMVPDLMKAIIEKLSEGITLNGKTIKVKQLGEIRDRDDSNGWMLLFDVLNPDDTFDHIEFMVTKTGWGRSV